MTRSLRELRGKPVLTLDQGEEIGRVRGFLLDPGEMRIVALVLDRRGPNREPLVVATANLYQVGDAAITVEKRDSLMPLSRVPRFQELARSQSPILGKPAITEDGTRLGRVRDLALEVPNLRVGLLLVGGFLGRTRRIPAEQVRTIGPDAVVVRLGGAEAPSLPRPVAAAEPSVPSEVLVPGSGSETSEPAPAAPEPTPQPPAAESPGAADWERWVEQIPGAGGKADSV
ncbi:MAG: PRC-barrel domain-containing protein [Chloroflexia bacterium]